MGVHWVDNTDSECSDTKIVSGNVRGNEMANRHLRRLIILLLWNDLPLFMVSPSFRGFLGWLASDYVVLGFDYRGNLFHFLVKLFLEAFCSPFFVFWRKLCRYVRRNLNVPTLDNRLEGA